jgi:hypothetical protein
MCEGMNRFCYGHLVPFGFTIIYLDHMAIWFHDHMPIAHPCMAGIKSYGATAQPLASKLATMSKASCMRE